MERPEKFKIPAVRPRASSISNPPGAQELKVDESSAGFQRLPSSAKGMLDYSSSDQPVEEVVKHYTSYAGSQAAEHDGTTTVVIPVEEGLLSVAVTRRDGRTIIGRQLVSLKR